MKAFAVMGEGTMSARFEPVEAALLTQLASQVAGMLSASTAAAEDGAAADPAVARLLPDAYRHDAEASAEFRRFTSEELVAAKVQNAQAVIADVAEALVAEEPTEVRLSAGSVQAWVRSLTDIRLVIAARLGIGAEGASEPDADQVFMLGDVYDWLGWVQDSLVSALEET